MHLKCGYHFVVVAEPHFIHYFLVVKSMEEEEEGKGGLSHTNDIRNYP